MSLPEYTREQVATHASAKSAWIIIDSHVYDISSFAALHPGGEKLILEYAGKDATGDFIIPLMIRGILRTSSARGFTEIFFKIADWEDICGRTKSLLPNWREIFYNPVWGIFIFLGLQIGIL